MFARLSCRLIPQGWMSLKSLNAADMTDWHPVHWLPAGAIHRDHITETPRNSVQSRAGLESNIRLMTVAVRIAGDSTLDGLVSGTGCPHPGVPPRGRPGVGARPRLE